MMEVITFIHLDGTETVFQMDNGRIWLHRLFGAICGKDGEDDGPLPTQGLVALSTSLGSYEGKALRLAEFHHNQDTLFIAWQTASSALRAESYWSHQMGVISRQDRLINIGKFPITLYRFFARFPLSMAKPEVYAQKSLWCQENQGGWIPLHTGRLALSNQGGRTTMGGTPYVCVRELGSSAGLAFHLCPCGNWTIQAHAFAASQSSPFALIELGQSEEALHLTLQPGEVFESPEILIHNLPHGEPHLGAERLHAFLLRSKQPISASDARIKPPISMGSHALKTPPLVYNTWFFEFDRLDAPSLRQQLAAAKEVGCEIFVIDAGWFGPQGPGWWRQVGDWREKIDASFKGQMANFAQEVRAAGLGFGLWIEPERFSPIAPIRQEHPEWFLPAQGEFARINLENPPAYRYLRDEIMRLVETYQLAWMKIDSNFELGDDPSGAELHGYYTCWFQLLDEIRHAYPETFFEGCASGGMRLDLNMLAHFDAHFLSDTVNPVDGLRIRQGALLRLPPGRLTHWAVLRSAGNRIPWYNDPMSATWPESFITPRGASWQPSETTDVDFTLLAAMPGILGLSGDLAGLPDETRRQIRRATEFYKVWRKMITDSIAHLLTPPRPLEDRTGWVSIQLQDPENTNSLLFTYRLDDRRAVQAFPLRNLDPQAWYLVRLEMVEDRPEGKAKGFNLMSNGFEVRIDSANRAAVYSIRMLKDA